MTSITKNFPDGWQQTTVDKVLVRYFTGPSPTCEERNISNSEEWGVLKTTAVTWEGWDLLAHKTLPKKYWGLSNLEIHSGDVLITKAGPRHRCGVVIFVDSTIPHLIVSGKMVGLRPNTKKVLPIILSLALAQSEPQKYLDIRTTGMAESQLNFTNENLLKTPITIPSLPEQSLIFNIWSSLDKAIKKTDQIIEKYKSIKQGLMQDLFKFGIDEKGQIRSEKTHKLKDSPLGRIPEEWKVEKFSTNIKLRYGSGLNEENRLGENYPVYGSNGIVGYHNSFLVKGPGIIVGRKGTIGAVNWSEGDYYPIDTTYYVTHTDQINLRWLYYYLNILNLQSLNSASGTPGLNREEVYKLLIKRPEITEQERVLQILDISFASINKEEAYKQKLLSLKQGLMADLLSGKVRVNKLMN